MGTYTGNNNNNIFQGTNGESWTLNGRGGNDYLAGAEQEDVINGGTGNDTLLGNAGYDNLYGDDGDDTLIDIDGLLDGGTGVDTLVANYSQLSNGAGVDVGYLEQNSIFSRLDGTEILDYTNIEKFDITGSQYADVLRGGASSDTLRGGGGNDQIEGRAGYDYLYGEAGDDTLIDTDGSVDGGAGVDTLVANYSQLNNGAGVDIGYLGQDVIFSRLTGTGVLGYSNIEKFDITGSKYADVLRGGAGSDTLRGGAGNDQIEGRAGYDYLYGEAGDDILSDTDGFVDGGAGVDTLVADYSQLSNGAGVDVAYTGVNAIFSRLSGNPVLNYTNIEKFDITGSQYADVLRGGAGNDILNGGASNDILNGAAGNDILVGGAGNDILNGSLGADNFVFNSKLDGIDTIQYFGRGEGDKIQISKIGFGVADLSNFSYNDATGALFFQGTQFATIENKPGNFAISTDLQLI
ncbi:calcium-binding protein [Nostoc sp. FACHB-145]|uniref:calcium-binding protein n=1 Tax=Nostoc sp. FACHB-145 TaxID=2692836 RepID=UPI001682A0E2|nr:calcium-binding protein [Nostoc sp. FACHB-145]MBD2471938.1 hypothetical protein [Nostoc sp. FACHB-145]